jgi:ribosomal protein L29
MKKSKIIEARSKEITELKKQLMETQQQLVKLRLEIASGKIKNTKASKSLRKDIAQLLTLIKEKEAR